MRAGAARFFMASVVRASNYRADMELVKTIHEAGPGPSHENCSVISDSIAVDLVGP